jgi:hypothetical protein
MAWKQTGNRYTENNYAVMEHVKGGKRWFTLECGSEYVGPSYDSLAAAKAAAAAHAQTTKKPRRGPYMAKDIDFDESDV